MMRSMISMLCVLAWAATASAECAWVMWAKQALSTKPGHLPKLTVEAAYGGIEDCTRALDQGFPDTRGRSTSTVVTLGNQMFMCLPDTVDPRGPKEK
jgi:hypothetical protein